jgi:Glycosyltransferase family 87
VGWGIFGYVTFYAITTGWHVTTGHVRLVDWHVFDAGARQLLARDLYRVPLQIEGLPLSASEFRLPPFAALWAVPLAGLPVDLVAGVIWQVVAAGSVAVAAVLGALIARLAWPALWAGLLLGPLSLTLWYLEGLHLGTNNYLVLLLVAAFCWCYLGRQWRVAGLLLGAAVATKLWPATLAVVAIRERRWSMLGWAMAILVAQSVLALLWLGPDVVGPMLRTVVEPIPPTGYLLGPTAIPSLREVWNAGLGLAVGIGLLLIPARGRLGFGLAILAALAVVGNLWIHYGPTILFALVLIFSDSATAALGHWRGRSTAPLRST